MLNHHEFDRLKIHLFHVVQEGQLALLTTCLLNPYTTRRQLTDYMSKSAIQVDK